MVTGGTDARDESWSETTFVLSSDGRWRTREFQLPNPALRAAGARGLAAARDLVSGDGGCHAVVRGELLVVGPVVHCGLPSDSFMAHVRRADTSLMNRGGAAAATRIVRRDESRRRRGWDADSPWRRVPAAPRPRPG